MAPAPKLEQVESKPVKKRIIDPPLLTSSKCLETVFSS